MIKKIAFSLALSIAFTTIHAQGELNASVRVSTPQLQRNDRRVFDQLEVSLKDFLNNTKWTNDNFEQQIAFAEQAGAQAAAGALSGLTGGVADIVVRKIEYRPGIIQKCFWIIHPDGGATDFSYRNCFGMQARDGGVAEAARTAVWPGIVAYKRQRFGNSDAIPCDETGALVSFADADVDHDAPWPFSRILREFFTGRPKPQLRDEQVRMVFACPDLAAEFIAFHDERARLRIVERKVNISMGAREAA